MCPAAVLILGTSFLRRNENTLTALLTVALTVGAALAADRWLTRRTLRSSFSAEVDTRLRFLRRFVTLVIVVLGLLFALSQFGGLHQLASGVLASSAIVAAVVGFAARQVLANLVAGVMLTITQPLRIGDQVAIDDRGGVVEDVRLNYTVLRAADGARLFIPNERLAASVLRNDTIIDPSARPEVSLWLPQGVDPAPALAVLTSEDPAWTVRAAEVTPEGTRLTVGSPEPVADRFAAEGELRVRGLSALNRAGVIAPAPPAGPGTWGPNQAPGYTSERQLP